MRVPFFYRRMVALGNWHLDGVDLRQLSSILLSNVILSKEYYRQSELIKKNKEKTTLKRTDIFSFFI